MRRGGKGALISREKSLSLLNHNEQVLFVPDKARSLTARNDGSPCVDRGPDIVAAGFKHKASPSAGNIGYKLEAAPTLMEGQESAVAVYDMTHADEVMRPVEGGKCQTLNARMGTGGNQVPVLAYTQQAFGEYEDTGKASALKARDYKDATDLVAAVGNGQADQTRISDKVGAPNCMHDQQAVMVQKSVRRLTPTECERLQGLPDGYTLIDDKTCSDTARYKALGNGMAQPCADYVIRRIREVTT